MNKNFDFGDTIIKLCENSGNSAVIELKLDKSGLAFWEFGSFKHNKQVFSLDFFVTDTHDNVLFSSDYYPKAISFWLCKSKKALTAKEIKAQIEEKKHGTIHVYLSYFQTDGGSKLFEFTTNPSVGGLLIAHFPKSNDTQVRYVRCNGKTVEETFQGYEKERVRFYMNDFIDDVKASIYVEGEAKWRAIMLQNAIERYEKQKGRLK